MKGEWEGVMLVDLKPGDIVEYPEDEPCDTFSVVSVELRPSELVRIRMTRLDNGAEQRMFMAGGQIIRRKVVSELTPAALAATAKIILSVFHDKDDCLGEIAHRTIGLQVMEILTLLDIDAQPHFDQILEHMLSYLDNNCQAGYLRVLQDFLMEANVVPPYLALVLMVCTTLGRCRQWVQNTMKSQPNHQAQQVSSSLNKLEKCMRVMRFGVLEGSRGGNHE